MHNAPNRTDAAPRRWLAPTALAALALAAALAVGYVVLTHDPADGHARDLVDEGQQDKPAARPDPFAGWGKPDLVLVLSGQMHGYVDPCGCSHPQYGGLIRRYKLIDLLKQKGWEVVGIDLGELATNKGLHEQNLLKFEHSLKALGHMGYRAVGIGKHELNLPLAEALNFEAKRLPTPVSLSLAETGDKKGLYFQLGARPFEVVDNVSPKLGVLSFIGPELEDSFKARKEKFVNNKQALPAALAEMGQRGVEVGVILHHEYPDPEKAKVAPVNKERWIDDQRLAMAERCAKACEALRQKDSQVPPVHLLMILTEEPEPPGVMRRIEGTPTHVAEIGHKGKYVGVVGVYKRPAGIELKYQMVLITPDFDHRDGEKNPVLDQFEEYSRQVQKLGLLNKVTRSPHPSQVDPLMKVDGLSTHYVGSKKCGECHDSEYKLFLKTGHSHAMDSLVNAQKPGLRNFDPECVVCHVVGLQHPTGYNDPRGGPAALKEHNANLGHVGCESCHGPGYAHTKAPNNRALYPIINPYRPTDGERKAVRAIKDAESDEARKAAEGRAKMLFDRRMSRLDDFCQKCHDPENDVNWTNVSFLKKWVQGGIIHNSPENVGNRWLKALDAKKDAAPADDGKK